MNLPPAIETLCREGQLGEIDRHLATLLMELTDDKDPFLPLAAALASQHTRGGHACIDLDRVAGRHWPPELEPEGGGVVLPPLEDWLAQLRASPAVANGLEAMGTASPLVLHGSRLYLHRMWQQEQSVAGRLRELATHQHPEPADLARVINGLFDSGSHRDGCPDALPRQAAQTALRRQLCCISGGPGTGKTTTVAKIVLALMRAAGLKSSDIAFAAPTGKAAARLQEATRENLAKLYPAWGTADQPTPPIIEVSTIHRWLMQDATRIWMVKALIIDEASMVDMQLMARVLQALPRHARLILLGDAHQLASVEPGSIFADICAADSKEQSPLHHCLIKLQHNWRFSGESGIGQLAVAIKSGFPDALRTALDPGQEPQDEVSLEPLPDSTAFERLAHRFTDERHAGTVRQFRQMEPDTPLQSHSHDPFRRFMTLCAHRRGRFGAEHFTELVEKRLAARGLASADEEFYPGRPIIVTRNDRDSGLANGDTGVVVRRDQGMQVWFPGLQDAQGNPRLVTPQRLPPHESFFALSVHRSQGSEYEEVAVIPGPAESSVNTRELLYTAVTRARKKVVIYGSLEGLKIAAGRATSRGSGLQDALG